MKQLAKGTWHTFLNIITFGAHSRWAEYEALVQKHAGGLEQVRLELQLKIVDLIKEQYEIVQDINGQRRPKEHQMSDHQHPKDDMIARRLIELSKTPDCICDVETSETPGMRFDVELAYDLSCPVHFPNTSTIIGRRHGR